MCQESECLEEGVVLSKDNASNGSAADNKDNGSGADSKDNAAAADTKSTNATHPHTHKENKVQDHKTTPPKPALTPEEIQEIKVIILSNIHNQM